MPEQSVRHNLDKPLGNENFSRAMFRALVDELDVAIPMFEEYAPSAKRGQVPGTDPVLGASGDLAVTGAAQTLIGAPAAGRYRFARQIKITNVNAAAQVATLRSTADAANRILNSYSVAAKGMISLAGIVLPAIGLEILSTGAGLIVAAADWVDLDPRDDEDPIIGFAAPAADVATQLLAAPAVGNVHVIESLFVHNPDASDREIGVRLGAAGTWGIDHLAVPAGTAISLPTPLIVPAGDVLQVWAYGSANLRFSASGFTAEV